MPPKSSSKPRHFANSAQHARNVEPALDAWWNPSTQDPDWNAPLEEDPPLTKDELQIREHQYHVERVADIVPYWIKCVDAAAKGEELRLEPFLNTLKDASQSWMTSDNPWAQASGSGAWGNSGDAGRWGVHPDMRSVSSSGRGSSIHTGTCTAATGGSTTGRVEKRKSGRSRNSVDHQKAAYAFVEDIARHEAADAERKRRMHMFFEMPTHEKVQKIAEIVRCLQSASV